MAKALELDSEALMTAQPIPSAAQAAAIKPNRNKLKVESGRVPLQVRWSAKDVKDAKLAAIQLDFPTVSDFMLACFHAYTKSTR
jgi:hypothetical protein